MECDDENLCTTNSCLLGECYFTEIPGCADPCCEANDTPGCAELTCEKMICSIRPSCCEIEWDEIGAGLAPAFCGCP